jgi:hypothetical protein
MCKQPFFRSLESPSEALRLVCGCALLLLHGQRDMAWDSAREVLSDPEQIRGLSHIRCEELAYKHIRVIKVQLKVRIFKCFYIELGN